jgi:uncharacterized protein YjiS (DUF1127 family)
MIATALDRLDARHRRSCSAGTGSIHDLEAIPALASASIATAQVETLSRGCADNSHDRRRQPRNLGGSALAVIEVMLALIRVWRERRRTRRRLAVMSERELQDIGICWSDIAYETGKPFWRAFNANAFR